MTLAVEMNTHCDCCDRSKLKIEPLPAKYCSSHVALRRYVTETTHLMYCQHLSSTPSVMFIFLSLYMLQRYTLQRI